MAAGNLTASQILRIQLKAEEMWKDSRLNQEYEAYTDTAKAVLKNQTARLGELSDPDKENQVRVVWVDPCGRTTQDCTDPCVIQGVQPGTSYKDYALDMCQEAIPFAISEEKARTNMYSVEELYAKESMLAMKSLDEWWSVQLLLKAKAYSGINAFPGDFTYTNGTTNVPKANYTVDLLAYLVRTMMMNKMPNAYIVDNGALWNSIFKANLNSGNLDGKGDAEAARRVSGMLTEDMWNFTKAGITEDTFVIGNGALAFKTKARFMQAATPMGGQAGTTAGPKAATPFYIAGNVNQWRWSQASMNLPGVFYDFYSTLTCVGDDIVHNVKVKTRGGIFQNPLGCPITVDVNGTPTQFNPTGIISLSQAA